MRDSNRQADSGIKYITPEEARERGLKYKDPPDSVTCKYCGKRLDARGVIISGTVIWKPYPPRCDCKEAQEYWAEHDRKEKRREQEEKEAELLREKRERINRLLGNSGIKRRFLQRTFSSFHCDTPARKECYEAAKEYADHWNEHKEKGDGLYIEGTNGTGKTHLAVAIALQLIDEGVPVICKTGSDLLTDIKRAFDNPELQEHQILDAYRRVDLLIIDDFGKEQCSDWSMSMLYTILNDRYEEMRPTIITTNYNTEELLKAMTPKGLDDYKIRAIISRLWEVSNVITMAWEDCRNKKGE